MKSYFVLGFSLQCAKESKSFIIHIAVYKQGKMYSSKMSTSQEGLTFNHYVHIYFSVV